MLYCCMRSLYCFANFLSFLWSFDIAFLSFARCLLVAAQFHAHKTQPCTFNKHIGQLLNVGMPPLSC